MKSRDKPKHLHLFYNIVYGHQAFLDGGLTPTAPNRKVKKCFDNMVLQGHVTNKNHYISTIRVPMTTKLSRRITYFHGLLPIGILDFFYMILKPLYLQYPCAYSHETW